MTDIIKFPELANSILKSLNLSKECLMSIKKGEEFLIFVNIDGWEVARIWINKATQNIRLSFNYASDPALVACIVLIMAKYPKIEVYESYRICKQGKIFWIKQIEQIEQ